MKTSVGRLLVTMQRALSAVGRLPVVAPQRVLACAIALKPSPFLALSSTIKWQQQYPKRLHHPARWLSTDASSAAETLDTRPVVLLVTQLSQQRKRGQAPRSADELSYFRLRKLPLPHALALDLHVAFMSALLCNRLLDKLLMNLVELPLVLLTDPSFAPRIAAAASTNPSSAVATTQIQPASATRIAAMLNAVVRLAQTAMHRMPTRTAALAFLRLLHEVSLLPESTPVLRIMIPYVSTMLGVRKDDAEIKSLIPVSVGNTVVDSTLAYALSGAVASCVADHVIVPSARDIEAVVSVITALYSASAAHSVDAATVQRLVTPLYEPELVDTALPLSLLVLCSGAVAAGPSVSLIASTLAPAMSTAAMSIALTQLARSGDVHTLSRLLNRPLLAQSTAAAGSAADASTAIDASASRDSKADVSLATEQALRRLWSDRCALAVPVAVLMLTSLARDGNVQRVLRFYRDFLNDELLTPGPELVTMLASLCRSFGNLDVLIDLRKLLMKHSARLSPPALTEAYNTLLYAAVQTGSLSDLDSAYGEMQGAGVSADRETMHMLVTCYVHAGQYDQACAVYDGLRAQGLTPAPETFVAYIQVLARLGRADALISSVESMRDTGIELTAETYALLMGAFAQRGDADRVLSLFEAMKTHGVKRDALTYVAVCEVYLMRGQEPPMSELAADMALNNVAEAEVTRYLSQLGNGDAQSFGSKFEDDDDGGVATASSALPPSGVPA